MRPRLTPNPSLALKDGKVFMTLGTPGGDVQCQAMVQVFLNVVLFGMDPQAAIEAPRFSSYSFPGSFEPHAYFPGQLALEGRIDGKVESELAALGHRTFWWDDYTWLAGAPCARAANKISGTASRSSTLRYAGPAISAARVCVSRGMAGGASAAPPSPVALVSRGADTGTARP